MIFSLSDYELAMVCKNSPDCGHNCLNCEAYQANQHYHQTRDENEDDDDG